MIEEESGTSVDPTAPPTRTGGGFVIEPTMVQLTPEQLEKIAKAIEAAQAAIDALGDLGGMFAKWALKRVLEGLKELGPIPPLVPPLGTQEPSAPPPTTPP